ncbi:hypothetical protein L579_4329 [Pantoea sp. AS-PWVM4]|nr:hypothetical protein L579_4329 [Pantoea sp. AS-PWVM4]
MAVNVWDHALSVVAAGSAPAAGENVNVGAVTVRSTLALADVPALLVAFQLKLSLPEYPAVGV